MTNTLNCLLIQETIDVSHVQTVIESPVRAEIMECRIYVLFNQYYTFVLYCQMWSYLCRFVVN